jgi:hypothetical protein
MVCTQLTVLQVPLIRTSNYQFLVDIMASSKVTKPDVPTPSLAQSDTTATPTSQITVGTKPISRQQQQVEKPYTSMIARNGTSVQTTSR